MKSKTTIRNPITGIVIVGIICFLFMFWNESKMTQQIQSEAEILANLNGYTVYFNCEEISAKTLDFSQYGDIIIDTENKAIYIRTHGDESAVPLFREK